MSGQTDRAVFTIATGKPIYLEMAAALARSFRQWHQTSDIRFFLATDRARSQLPPDLAKLDLIPLKSGQYGSGFTPKLHLDRIAPAKQSLFIDADCLCVRALEPAFSAFAGNAVSVIGRPISDGAWAGVDVARLCRLFGVPAIFRFNGGVYYLERGPACERVYETARGLLPRYDEIGFGRLRGECNEEPLMSLALALCRERAVPETGTVMNSLLAAPGGLEIDVLRGRAVLHNPLGHPAHNPWYSMEEMQPAIVHFCGADLSHHLYGAEIAKLKKVHEQRWSPTLARFWVGLTYAAPARLLNRAKAWVRPAFHALFGPRRVRVSGRL